MKYRFAGTLLACITCGSTAFAGGLERNIPRIAPLFEDGRYLEFSTSYVMPNLSGDGGLLPPEFGGPAALTGSTGNLLDDYFSLGAAYKADINDRISYALMITQPFGAATSYPAGSSASPVDAANIYGNSTATLDSYRLETILAVEVANGFSLYAGPMIQAMSADASIAFLSYSVDSNQTYGFGYLLGAAYERPDIALRASLTYRSAIKHDFDTTEVIGAATVNSQTEIETPQSVTLDFQTGIAPKTLLFGQVHWMDWSEFTISPPNYPLLTSAGRPLVAYEEDWWSYTLGLGRQVTDTVSAAASVTWEPQTNTELTTLGPIDGRWSFGLGGTYETDRIKLSGGLSYTLLGDAENVLATDYSGGDAIGVGLRIGFKL